MRNSWYQAQLLIIDRFVLSTINTLEFFVKKSVLAIAVIGTAFLTACGGTEQAAEPVVENTAPNLESLEAKVSYLLGYSNAAQLQAQGVVVEYDAFVSGAKAAIDGEEPAIGEEEGQAAFIAYQEKLQEESASQLDQLAVENLAKSEAFLAENATVEGVMTTESGLQYKVLEAAEGEMPTVDSTVQVHYEGRLINGDIFDSSIARGAPVEFALTQVISGWTEGLQLMPEGSKYEFYIPGDLAYGPGGSRSIGPNEALIFVVELIQANYNPEVAEEASAE